jgi:hypothetical protein
MRRNRSNPFSRLFAAVAVTMLTIVAALAVVETTAGWALKAIRGKRPAFTVESSDDTIGKLYDTDQPQRYREIRDEVARLADTVYSPFVEFRNAPVSGKHFTVTEDGYRLVSEQPQDLTAPGRKVFVFGGSTALGVGVGGDETIAAYLGQALKAAGRTDVQVFNFGAQSYFSTQERILLERLLAAGVKPDVAVFIDGLGDFDYCAAPDRSSWSERLAELTRARTRLPLSHELAHRSNVVQLIRHLSGDKSVAMHEWGAFCAGEADIDKVVARLDANRRMIDAMADRLGFKTVFVQQPVPTFSYDNRKRPFPVPEEMLGYHMNSARGYPRLAEMRGKAQLWERNLLWLAELEPAEGNAYIDAIHYSPRFNKAIGERISAAIAEGGLLP